MSTFENDQYQWRETYFVLFDSARRPSLRAVEKAIHKLARDFRIVDPAADDDGKFESLTVQSDEDFAAIDISFLEGEEATSQAIALAGELEESKGADAETLARLCRFDARFDVLHFEHVAGFSRGEEDEEDMLDPGSLLNVLEALVELTGGLGYDPQAGALL
jgi:hypothetical protein